MRLRGRKRNEMKDVSVKRKETSQLSGSAIKPRVSASIRPHYCLRAAKSGEQEVTFSIRLTYACHHRRVCIVDENIIVKFRRNIIRNRARCRRGKCRDRARSFYRPVEIAAETYRPLKHYAAVLCAITAFLFSAVFSPRCTSV